MRRRPVFAHGFRSYDVTTTALYHALGKLPEPTGVACPKCQQGELMQRRGNLWVTVVGDVPSATLKLFAEAVARKAP